ncbi:MAG: cytochrome P450 [Acidimicrobiales bacterium]
MVATASGQGSGTYAGGRPGRRRPEEAPVLCVSRSLPKAFRMFNTDRLGWAERAASAGPLVGLQFGPIIGAYILTDAEVARAVLMSERWSWRRSPSTMTPVRMAIGDFLFTQEERVWSLVQPFLSPDLRKRALEPRLAELGELIEDHVTALPVGRTLDLDQAMGRLALSVAAWVLFGQHLERSRADELYGHQRAIVDWVGRRAGALRASVPYASGRAARTMRGHRQAVHAYVDEIVERRRREGSARHDLLDALLAARPGGRALSQSELRSHVAGMFGAGNETTAAALGWAIVHGAANPAEWAALRAGAGDHAAHYAAETLRLHPPAWSMNRSAVSAGQTLSAGGCRARFRRRYVLSINVWGLNRDAGTWPEPEAFSPSRHAKLTRAQERAFMPFGLGARGCIGQHLAVTEMLAALPLLARHGDVSVEGEARPDPTFTLRARDGLRGCFSPPARR